jgi:hypothetical protein
MIHYTQGISVDVNGAKIEEKRSEWKVHFSRIEEKCKSSN